MKGTVQAIAGVLRRFSQECRNGEGLSVPRVVGLWVFLARVNRRVSPAFFVLTQLKSTTEVLHFDCSGFSTCQAVRAILIYSPTGTERFESLNKLLPQNRFV
jgi:hypothetical protein